MARELKMCVLQFKAGGLIWAKRSPDVTGVVREVLKARGHRPEHDVYIWITGFTQELTLLALFFKKGQPLWLCLSSVLQ